MSEAGMKRRSVRQRAERKSKSIYYEPDSDDFDAEDSDGAQDFEEGLQPPPAKKRKTRRGKPTTRSAAQSRRGVVRSGKAKASRSKKKKHQYKALGMPLKEKDKKQTQFNGLSDGKIPDWTSLPLDILRDCFVYASQPMLEQTTTASANVTWLMRAARTCRAFAVPALEAYYHFPYPLTNLQTHHLLELMSISKEKTYIDYTVKTRSLEIDVNRLAYAATGRDKLDVGRLVRQLPQLQHFEIVHSEHTPPFRELKGQKWTYPVNLVESLEAGGARLKSWRWTRSIIPSYEASDIYPFISRAHRSKAFEPLERLVVCGFDVNDSSVSSTSEDDTAPRVPMLALAVSELSQLKDLTFISCDLVMENFLEHIPKNLQRLELSNCLEVTSDLLQTYLATGGSHLRELVLNYNPALDLTFLPPLKLLCPRLEVLKMDLTYYSERYNYNDAFAMYDQLLTEDEVPTWPSTLRHLELVNLQKWNAEAAQTLFRSLVDGAEDLPDLRHLVIQAHINIPWRDRAGFRDQWIERLNRVYLRKSEPPNPFLGSLKQFRLWKKAQAEGRTVTALSDLKSDDESTTRRGLDHVRITPCKPPADTELYSDSGPSAEKQPRSPARRSVRVAERVESQNVSTAAEESSSSDSEDEAQVEWRQQPEAFIQGLCRVVDIRIDNQRPRENQYTEANFLDTEPSGDEDWHSGAELSEDGYAW